MLQRRDALFTRPPSGAQDAAASGSPAALPATPSRGASAAGRNEPEGGSRLIVGPNIRMKGVEIADCDTLVVEGHVEATLDSRVIRIAPSGAFSGAAGIDDAEIRGEFSGELTVRNCLTIYASGKVSGKIRYKKMIIEEGGELSGEIVRLGDDAARQAASTRTASSAGSVPPVLTARAG